MLNLNDEAIEKAREKILALLSAEGISIEDYDKCISSLSECVAGKKIIEIYKSYIYNG